MICSVARECGKLTYTDPSRQSRNVETAALNWYNTEIWDREGGESAAFKNVGNHIATMTSGSEGREGRLMLKLIVQKNVYTVHWVCVTEHEFCRRRKLSDQLSS